MFQNFIFPCLYEAQHVSGDTPPIIMSLKLHCQPLVFYTWKVVGLCHAEKSNKMQQCFKILFFHVDMKLNMFRATHRPSLGA
jgi:hypothetical protein